MADELLNVCRVLNIDPAHLQARPLQEFMTEEGGDSIAAKVKFEHAEKRRKLKIKQVQEFMISLRKKSRQGVCLNLLPKESVLELKKSRRKFNLSNL
jgi:hypothetical protein